MVELEVGTKVDTSGIDSAGDAVNDLSSSLDNMTGGAVTAFKSIVSGAKKGVMAMRTLRGAMMATGIGALVVAVGTLVSYFSNTQEGADKLNQVFAVVGATVDALTDRISKIGGAIVKLFSGDFKGAVDDLTTSFDGLTNEILREAAAALELEKANQALRDSQIELTVEIAKQRSEVKRLNQIAEDTTKTDEERVAAAKEAIQIEKDLLAERLRNAEENYRIIRETNALSESTAEDRQKEADAEAEVFNLRTESLELQTTLTNKLNILEASLFARRQKEREEAELARRKAMVMDEIESAGSSELTPSQQTRLTQEELLQKKLNEVNARGLNEMTETQKHFADKDLEIQQSVTNAKIGLANSLMTATTSLLEQGSTEAKAVAAAQAIFNAYLAINNALATIPQPAASFVAAGVGATAFANVASILNTPNRVGSGGSFGGNTINVGNANQGSGNLPNLGFTDESALGNGQEAFRQPVRAYVINQDIKSEQSLAQTIQDRQRI